METLADLQRRLESFPKGYLSYKKIHGKRVAYLQFRAKEGIHSTYVKPDDLPIVFALIEERKKLEEEIALRKKKEERKLSLLSEKAKELTGSLFSGDEVVAEFENNRLIWINEKKAPFWVVRTKELTDWLSHRCIDSTRPNSRFLKEITRLGKEADPMVSLSVHGATLTDDYWFRPKHSKLKYEDIAFCGDSYFHLALFGDSSYLAKKPLRSPELTNIGSFEKAWKKQEDGWWLYKKETPMELFSELFACLLGEKMGFSMAHYEKEGNLIKSKDFAETANYEPMMALLGDEEDYDVVYRFLSSLDPKIAFSYLKLIWFDSFIHNVDRHNENYGLLREKGSGKILSLAPNFDNNLALFAQGYPKGGSQEKDGLIHFFAAFLKKNEQARDSYRKWELPPLCEKDIRAICQYIGIPVDEDLLVSYLLERYRVLSSLKGV